MNGGFSYNDVDIAELGLSYAPEIENTYAYHPAQSTIHEEMFDGHDGGYFYGVTRQPKEFILRCVFEEERIDRGIITRIHSVFRVGSSGRLIFQRRPWCYYNVVITEVTEGFTNYLNGTVTIKAKAYYPYARSDAWYSERNSEDYADLMRNSAVMDKRSMVLPTEVNCSPDVTSTKTIYLVNPGTESSPVGIEIAGDAPEGVYITNMTNGDQCKYVALTKEATTNKGKYIYTDPINGLTVLKNSTSSTTCFLYHDYGFISLEPAFPAMRDVYATTRKNNKKVTTSNILYDFNHESLSYANLYYANKHIYLNGEWIQIARLVDLHTLEVKQAPTEDATERTTIMQFNEINIAPVSTMSLTRLNFVYKPTYS